MRWTRRNEAAAEIGGFIIKSIIAIVVIAYIYSWAS